MNLLLNTRYQVIFAFILSFHLCSIRVVAQERKYTVANAHAHNDYLHPVPFYTAFNAGFGSIEADVFPANGVLCVAHSKGDIQPQLTLKHLYLDPLLHELAVNNSRKLILLIDVKENYEISLKLLMKELEPLTAYLSTTRESRALTILISGERPPPEKYKNYPDYIFFDDDLQLPHAPYEWKRVGLVSLPFYKISAWKGEEEINGEDQKHLRHVIDSVQSAGKPIRFWAAPDTEASWKLQMVLHADLIGTDKISELQAYLRHL